MQQLTARKLSEELHIPATSYAAMFLNVNDYITDKFDIIFSSYGVMGWLR
jgi:hypothetical protein